MYAWLESNPYSSSELGKDPYITSLDHNKTLQHYHQDYNKNNHSNYYFWYILHTVPVAMQQSSH